MLVRINRFTGEFPKLDATALPENAAVLARDCDFVAERLQGLNEDNLIFGVSAAGAKSLFVYDGTVYGNTYFWNRDVDAVRSPIPSDQYSRFYWTDGSGFYVSRGDVGGGGEPSINYRAGVPVPSSAPALTSASFKLPDVTLITATLADEHTDGTVDNSLGVYPNWVYTATSMTGTFSARASQNIDKKVRTTTKNTTPTYATGVRPDNRYQYCISTSGLETSDEIFLYRWTYQSTELTFFYYDVEPVPNSLPIAANTFLTLVDDHYVYEWGGIGTVYRHKNEAGEWTNWFSTVGYGSGSFPPDGWVHVPPGAPTTKTSETTTETPYQGPVLTLAFTRSVGGNLTAKIRTDSTKTSWPAELPGITAQLTESGGVYTVSLGLSADQVERRAYVYTYVNAYGEEGAPSAPLELDCSPRTDIVLQYGAYSGAYCPISRVRLYRTATGATTSYLYVGEITYNSGWPYFTDNVKTAALGHTLDTTHYYPPSMTLRGVCLMPNGILAAFSGNEVWFSEPYLPYAWNPNCIKTFSSRVVGICPFEGGLYVLTTTLPYLVTGAAPEYMTDVRIPAPQALVAKNAVTSIGNGVVYASRDGLVVLQGTNASLDASFQFFSRVDWRERYGANLLNLHLNAHDGSILGWFDNGALGFLLRLDESRPTFTELGSPIYAAYVYLLSDELYVSNGTSLYAFRAASTRRSFTWRSRAYQAPVPVSMAVLQLFGNAGVTWYTLYGDGVVVATGITPTVASDGTTIIRLPAGRRYTRWQLELSNGGGGYISEALFATSMKELQSA